MLEALCGNKNVQKILLFLLVNSKCYGTQLNRLLKTALTPIQKALLRLEKGGIVISYLEGKTRLYQFNPSFPLLAELEQLLKKAYTLLPPQEKILYSTLNQDNCVNGISYGDSKQILRTCWERLACVTRLTFHGKSKSQEESGWNGKGKGEVSVTREGDTVLLFNEKGKWHGKEGPPTDFSNTFRWTLDREANIVSLEHLRRGANHPIFIFHLAPSSHNCLSPVESLLCEGDIYLGRLIYDQHGLRLKWRVIGPKKNEELDYYYV